MSTTHCPDCGRQHSDAAACPFCNTIDTTAAIVTRLSAEIMGAIDRALQEDLGVDHPRAEGDARQHVERIELAFALLDQINRDGFLSCNCMGACDGTCTHAGVVRVLGRE